MKKWIAILAMAAATAAAQDSLTGVFYVSPQLTMTKTNGASTLTEAVGRILSQSTSYGTNGTITAPQMNAWASEAGTLTNGEERVFSCAALTNGFGEALNLWRVNVLIVHSSSTNNVDALSIGGASDHLAVFGDTNQTATVRPGGVFVATAPDAAGIVSTGKVVRLANTGTNDLSFVVYIGGAR